MSISLLRIKSLNPILQVIVLLSWAFVAGNAISEAYEGPFILLSWVNNLLIALFFVSALMLAQVRADLRRSTDPEILLRKILVGGLFTLTLVLLSQLFPQGNKGPIVYFTSEIYPLLASLPLIVYLSWTFARLRFLIDERTASTRQMLKVFLGMLLLSAVAAFWPLPPVLLYIFYGLALIPAFSLLMRVRWIAGLQPGSRIFVMAYLFLITWVHLGLLLWFIVQDSQGIFHGQAIQNPFPLMLMMFNGLYALMALLAVLFNWPMSAIMERRNSDIDGFQTLHEQISHRGSAEDIQELLLDLCYRNSGAKAAWFTRPVEGGNQVQYLKRGEVALGQISRWESGLKLQQDPEIIDRDGHIYVSDAARHDAFKELAFEYRTALSFPMSVNGQHEGNLVLLQRVEDAFDDYAIRMLGTYVNQARLALEKNRLVAQAVENERMKNEFEIATRVQENLLPKHIPQPSWLQISAAYQPAQEVGGDCYDFFEKGEDLYMVQGDVTGKGMGAAFNVAELKGIFHSNLDYLDQPDEFLLRVNRAVTACFDRDIFLTLVYLGFRPLQNQFVYARAGHCPVLFYSASKGEATYLDDKGMGLGIVRDDSYRKYIQVNNHRFDTNDIIVLFSDGIMEAVNPESGEEYGQERIRQVVARHAFFTADEIKEKILEDVKVYLDGERAGDDITLLVIKFQ